MRNTVLKFMCHIVTLPYPKLIFWGMHNEYISLSQSLGHRQAPVHNRILKDTISKNNILVIILITQVFI
jgi:hypothetical protein